MTSSELPLFPVRPSAPAPGSLPPPTGWPLLRLGFRPFYLGAAAFAAISVPLWIAVLLGAVTIPVTVPPVLWHAHEMLFGFATAVIVGFLMTAGKAWTGLPTPRGAALGALAALWLSARVAAVMAPYPAYAALDMLLLPLVAAVLASILWRAGNRRNLPLAAILMLMAVANGAFHLAALGWVAIAPLSALHAALALIVMIECVMAGRVVPSFTISATPGLRLTPQPRLERTVLPVTAAALGAWVLLPSGAASVWLTAPLLSLAASLHLSRLWGWKPWLTRDRPILWILHAAYLWIPLGLALLALAAWGVLGTSPGIHALAVGATGGLIIGMITRTARGHTGRPLRVSRIEVAAYALVMAAALLRTLVPLVAWPTASMVAAATAWSAAFLLYLWLFVPWLMQSRLDGKDG